MQKRKTSSKKLTLALFKVQNWLRYNRDTKLVELISMLNKKLQGHYGYYCITFNSKGINSYFEQVKRILHKWLNRWGGKSVWNWDNFNQLIKELLPLFKPKIYHSFLSVKIPI